MSPDRLQAPLPHWTVTPKHPPGFRALDEAEAMVYWHADPAGNLLPAGGPWETFAGGRGFGPEGGAAWLNRVLPEDRKACRAAWKEATRHGRPLAILFRMRAVTGPPRWIRARAVPVMDLEGLCLAGSFEDITPEMEAVGRMHEGWATTLTLLDHSPLPTSVVSLDSDQVLYSNHALRELLALPEDPPAILDPTLFYENLEDLRNLQSLVAKDDLLEDFQCRMRTQKGKPFWASLTARKTEFLGKPVRIVSIRDITQAKAIRDRLAESESRFRNLFEQHSALLLLIRPRDGRILDANPAACRFYGYPLESLREMTIAMINDLDPTLLAVELGQALTHKVNHFTFNHRLSTGEERLVEVESVPIEMGGEKVLFSIIHDITERRKTEEALRRSEVALRQAQDLGGMGHFVLDVASGAVETSATLDQILGLPSGSPRTLASLGAVMPLDALRESLEGPLGPGPCREIQWECVLGSKASGQTPWVQIRALIAGEAPGRAVKVLGTVLDITERRRQEMLGKDLEAQVAKSRMAAYIAHEINGPLAGIQNAFLLVEAALPRDHPDRQYAELIKTEIKRISTIVKTLYELHKPVDPSPLETDVDTLLQEVQTLLSSYARTRQVELQRTPLGGTGKARLNVGAIRQVLYNLVQNAIEASPAGSRVTCATTFQDHTLTMAITDEGMGIRDEWKEHIWTPGFTTKAASPQGGLGLGLATCLRLVTCMGGTLECQNNPTRGCTFTVRVPESPTPPPGGTPLRRS